MWKEWEMKNWQRSDAQKVEGKRRRGRLRMRWEDQKDMERVGGEGGIKAKDRSWRVAVENVVGEN